MMIYKYITKFNRQIQMSLKDFRLFEMIRNFVP